MFLLRVGSTGVVAPLWCSRLRRICNIAFSVLLGIPAIILGVVLRKEPCDDPLASLLILTGVLPLCMAVKLAVLLRKTDERSASWSGQKAFSFVIGGIYFGVRILAQIYYFSSPNCSQNVLTAALFYMIVDYCTVCEGCAMLNSSFVRTLARRLKVPLPELNTEELFGPGDIDEEQSDDDEALTQAALSTRNSMP